MSEFGENLLQNIAEDFNKRIRNDKKLKQIANRVRDGTSYADANDFAIRAGELLSEAFTGQTDGLAFISKEVAQEAIAPMLEYLHDLVAETTTTVQTNMNAANGLGIGVSTPALDTNRIDGFVDKIASYDTLEQGQWMLKEPVINYSQAIVDQSIRDNCERAGKMGLKARIIRRTEPHACKWCLGLAGVYEYIGNGSNIPRDVYRRHESCRCIMTFANGKERQNVWDHGQAWSADDAEGQRKAVIQATEKREREAYEKAEAAKKRAEDIAYIVDQTGWDVQRAAIWRNSNIDAIREAGGAEKFMQKTEAEKALLRQAGEINTIMKSMGYGERQAYILWLNNKQAIESKGLRAFLKEFSKANGQ